MQCSLKNANDYYWLLFKKHHRLFMVRINIYSGMKKRTYRHTHTHTHTYINAFNVYLNLNASSQWYTEIFITKKLIMLTFDNDVREKNIRPAHIATNFQVKEFLTGKHISFIFIINEHY